MIEHVIPKNWVQACLEDLIPSKGVFCDGDWIESKDQDPNGEVRLLQLADIGDGLFINKSARFLTKQNAYKLNCTFLEKGDLLIARMPDPLGRACILPLQGKEKYVTVVDVCIVRLGEKSILNKFLMYLINSPDIRNQIERYKAGSTRKRISRKNLAKVILLIPPLNEQTRIVAKIDELFSELDKGMKNLKTAQAQLKVYRQAVLKHAFEGKLTAKWREENKEILEPIEQVLNRIGSKPMLIEKISSIPLLPEGWAWIKSGDFFRMVTSGSRGWAQFYSVSGALFIRIGNMDFNTLKLDLSKLQYVTLPSRTEGKRTKIEEGDFLFSITGYLGMFAIAPKLEEAYVNQHIALARPIDGFNKEFIGYYIIAKTGGYHHLNALTKGAVKAGLGLDDIKSFPVPICSTEEQEKIVEMVKEKLSIIENIEETIDNELQKSGALCQAILKAAFSGKLVEQDPDDEPANVLLERIHNEKESRKESGKKSIGKRKSA